MQMHRTTLRDGSQGGHRWMNWESGIDVCALPCKTTVGTCCRVMRTQFSDLWRPRWGGWGGSGVNRGRGYMHTYS